MDNVNLYYDEMNSPIGDLVLISSEESLVRIEYGKVSNSSEQMKKWVIRYFGDVTFVHSPEKLAQVKLELKGYFENKNQDFTFKFKFYGTSFQQQVWRALVETIPFGHTASYKDIAVAIGNPKAVRAVGGAVNKNPFSIFVPCHRVIGASGKMVGYNGGLDKKQFLLEHEKSLGDHGKKHKKLL